MESKQVNSAAADEQKRPTQTGRKGVRSSRAWLMRTRKDRTEMMRRMIRARVAQKKQTDNDGARVAQKRVTDDNGVTFTGLLHSVINRAHHAHPITSGPSVQDIAPDASGSEVPNKGKETIVLGNASEAPPVKLPEPTKMKEGSKMVEVGAEAVRRLYLVWTNGGTPTGKRIKGILYRPTQQGSIVCCCHGKFFTYSEFIEHAGGSNVDNPTKFIHVLPSDQ